MSGRSGKVQLRRSSEKSGPTESSWSDRTDSMTSNGWPKSVSRSQRKCRFGLKWQEIEKEIKIERPCDSEVSRWRGKRVSSQRKEIGVLHSGDAL